MSDLKSCPFCGDDVIYYNRNPFGDCLFACGGCGLLARFNDLDDPGHTFDVDAAIRLWNDRKELPEVKRCQIRRQIYDSDGAYEYELSCGHTVKMPTNSWGRPYYCTECGAAVEVTYD